MQGPGCAYSPAFRRSDGTFLGVLGQPRPTSNDAKLIREAFTPMQEGGPGVVADTTSQATPALAKQLGQWLPLLEAGLGKSMFTMRWKGVPKGLRPLDARTPILADRLATVFRSLVCPLVVDDLKDQKDSDTQPWEPLGEAVATGVPVPLYRVLALLGATQDSANARAAVCDHLETSLQNRTFLAPDSEKERPLPLTPRYLAALEWAGADWYSVDGKARTPLHTFCAFGQSLWDESSHDQAPAIVTRWLCHKRPDAMMLSDMEGLTPLNYLTAPLTPPALESAGSTHMEVVAAASDGVIECFRQSPVALCASLRTSEQARIALCAASTEQLDDKSSESGGLMSDVLGIVQSGVWECALAEWHQGLWQAQEMCSEAANIQARVAASRSLAAANGGQLDIIPAQAALREAGMDGDGEAAAHQLLEVAEAEWKEREDSLKERVVHLEAELGRTRLVLPSVNAEEGAAGAAPGAAGALLTPASAAPGAGAAPALADGEQGVLDEQRPSSAELEAEAFVQRIRQLRLVDEDLDAAPSAVSIGAQSVRQSLTRAVERLAVDLYELESHFVYELVQNADDNRYAEEEAKPTMRMLLRFEEGDEAVGRQAGAYFFSTNNELGLRPEDVAAVCDVNASSKAGRKGFTGNKGIGWKSCFQVSDCPYMLSGAFTFKFDVAGPLGRLGYVTPTWVDRAELARLPPPVLEAHAAGLTVIYLPLRTGAAASVSMALEHLEEHHLCLLFMRRLRRLEVEYSDGHGTAYEVVDNGQQQGSQKEGELQVSVQRHDGDRQAEPERLHFILHRGQVDLHNGDTGCISLAFPLPEGKKEAEQKQEGEQQQQEKEPGEPAAAQGEATGPGEASEEMQALYCGLPVRRVGFRFAINGPFELVASRGDIHEGSMTNQVLCQAIPEVFAHAMALHKKDLAPRTLAFIGPEPPDGVWRRVRSRLLASLQGAACIPVEGGGLAPPEECLLRPKGVLAAEASWLMPAELLHKVCGKRFASSFKAFGLDSCHSLGLTELGLEHWLAVLRHRSEDWPEGLAGRAALRRDGAGFFRPLFAWLGEEIQTAVQPSHLMQQLWDLELFPAEVRADDKPLLRLCDGPILDRFSRELSTSWQWTLCKHGLLRVLDQEVRTAMEGKAAAFASSLLVERPSRALIAGLCVEWHLLRFSNECLDPPPMEVTWTSLACLADTFHAGELPKGTRSDGTQITPMAATCEGGQLMTSWSALGAALWLPAEGGVPPLMYASGLVCPSYFGIKLFGKDDFAAVSKNVFDGGGAAAAAAAASSALGLAGTFRFVSLDYLDGTWGSPIRWEAFFHAIGVGISSLAPADGALETVRAHVSIKLGKTLVDAAWWQSLLKMPQAFDYVSNYIQFDMTQAEQAWLQALPAWYGPEPGDGPPLANISSLFLHSAYASIGGRFLPYAKLPTAEGAEEAARVEQVIECLQALGVTTTVNLNGLVQCVQLFRVSGCRDADLFADLYKQIATEVDMEAIDTEAQEALRKAVFVPQKGFYPARECTWQDCGIIQWLAGAPCLQRHYERYGAKLEQYFAGIAQVAKDMESFQPRTFLQALESLVVHVDNAMSSADASLPGAPITQQQLLDTMEEIAGSVYQHLVKACEKNPEVELKVAGKYINDKYLILLKVAGQSSPKRLTGDEAWWDVAEDLKDVESVTKLALKTRYGHIPGLQEFFTEVLEVQPSIDRESLKKLIKSTQNKAGETLLSNWSGLSISDIETLQQVQTTSEFRPVDWRPPGEDAEPPATGPPQAPDGPPRPASNPDGSFQPPQGGGAHVPAWRSRQDQEQEQRRLQQQREDQRRSMEAAAAARAALDRAPRPATSSNGGGTAPRQRPQPSTGTTPAPLTQRPEGERHDGQQSRRGDPPPRPRPTPGGDQGEPEPGSNSDADTWGEDADEEDQERIRMLEALLEEVYGQQEECKRESYRLWQEWVAMEGEADGYAQKLKALQAESQVETATEDAMRYIRDNCSVPQQALEALIERFKVEVEELRKLQHSVNPTAKYIVDGIVLIRDRLVAQASRMGRAEKESKERRSLEAAVASNPEVSERRLVSTALQDIRRAAGSLPKEATRSLIDAFQEEAASMKRQAAGNMQLFERDLRQLVQMTLQGVQRVQRRLQPQPAESIPDAAGTPHAGDAPPARAAPSSEAPTRTRSGAFSRMVKPP